MFDSLSGLFGQGGALQTGRDLNLPEQQAKINAGTPEFAEKGSILGMTPASFANIAGQAGAAIAPEGSWQQKLGTVASGFGTQKLAQLAQAEKEKRMTGILKQVMGQAKPKDIVNIAGPDGLQMPSLLDGKSLNVDPAFRG
jgi:hypothetical protein